MRKRADESFNAPPLERRIVGKHSPAVRTRFDERVGESLARIIWPIGDPGVMDRPRSGHNVATELHGYLRVGSASPPHGDCRVDRLEIEEGDGWSKLT